MEGRAATEKSHDKSVTREGAALTDFVLGSRASSVNIGIELY
jgi:hypothetical protein